MAIETIELIKQWATDRELHAADPMKQLWKLVEENGELAAGVLKQKPEMVEDAAGDMVVVMTILLMQLGDDIQDVFNSQDILGDVKKNNNNDFSLMTTLDGIYKLSNHLYFDKENLMQEKIQRIIGQILIGINGVCRNHDLYLFECINVAYTEIKDRKGKTINGSFVKEADL